VSVGSDGDAVRPLITVGITCYNAEDTIQRALESALAQTWPSREIVIVDDASTDRSGAILQRMKQAHPEIRVIRHQENRGYPGAMNTLLAQARGAFVALLDDDDESVPSRVEQQYRRIMHYEAMHPGTVIFCYSNRDVVAAGERNPTFRRLGIGRVPPEPSGPVVADYVLGLLKDDGRHCWGMFGSCTLMARTQALRRLGGFDARFRRRAELDLAVRAAFEGAHFISVDAPLVTQYLTPTVDKAGDAPLRYRLLLLKKHEAYLKKRRSYVGAWCYMHAQFYRSQRRQWRLWYLAALVCFPWQVVRERLRRSSLLARLRLSPARTASS
jgi:glycosyltransferase involved in cell wall biosynthesis